MIPSTPNHNSPLHISSTLGSVCYEFIYVTQIQKIKFFCWYVLSFQINEKLLEGKGSIKYFYYQIVAYFCVCVCVRRLSWFSCVWLLYPHGLQSARLLCPWEFLGKNTGVSCQAFLQGNFPTQGSNLRLPHCEQILYHWATGEIPFVSILLSKGHPSIKHSIVMSQRKQPFTFGWALLTWNRELIIHLVDHVTNLPTPQISVTQSCLCNLSLFYPCSKCLRHCLRGLVMSPLNYYNSLPLVSTASPIQQ